MNYEVRRNENISDLQTSYFSFSATKKESSQQKKGSSKSFSKRERDKRKLINV